jgi:hypothetical protein
MADMDKYIVEKYIDFDIIESYKKPITMPAKYLEVFSVVYKDFFSDKILPEGVAKYPSIS